MDELKNIELLKEEYFYLQKIVEDFDSKSLTIKAWSVTLSAAGLIAAYTQDASIVLVIAAASSLAFWIIEALWKENQQSFYPRIRAIEKSFRSNDRGAEIHPLQIAAGWSAAWHDNKKDKKLLDIILWPHVFIPHLPVFITGIILYFFTEMLN